MGDSGAAATTTKPTTQEAATRPQIDKATIWTDPNTKLITKGTFTVDDQTFTMTCTYGDPQIATIYDIGVPRDAKVIDNRVKQDVGGLLDRLQKRAERGFGDGVVVMTELTAGEDGKIVTTEGALHVFLRSGKAMYDARYLVGPSEGPNAAFYVPLPANWPTPSADDALAAVRNGTPTNFLASDGTHAWQGFGSSPSTMQVRAIDPNSKAEGFQFTVARFGMTANLWPTRNRLGLFGSNGKAEVITDPTRPGMIGLKVVQMIWTGKGDPQDRKQQRRAEQTYWLDPKRDDLPVESSWTNHKPGGDAIEMESKTTNLEMKQLPDGRWFPSRWKSVMKGAAMARDQVQENALFVFPGHKVPAEWFSNPVERVKAEKP
jgi:hypothetical protein